MIAMNSTDIKRLHLEPPSSSIHPSILPTRSFSFSSWLLPTCPLSKFSLSSSRLLAPAVRRITLGIALGTCCMELFTRSIAGCNMKNKIKIKSAPTVWKPPKKKKTLYRQTDQAVWTITRAAGTMAGSRPCCCRRTPRPVSTGALSAFLMTAAPSPAAAAAQGESGWAYIGTPLPVCSYFKIRVQTMGNAFLKRQYRNLFKAVLHNKHDTKQSLHFVHFFLIAD